MSYLHRAFSSWPGINLLALILCLLGAGLGTLLGGQRAIIPQNWPEIGVALALARITGGRCWLGIWLAMIATFDWELIEGMGSPIRVALLATFAGATTTAQVLVGARLLGVPAGEPNPLASRTGVLRLLLLSGLFAGIVGSFLRLLINLAFGLSLQDAANLIALRLTSHMAGVMVMAPVVFMAWYGPRPRYRITQVLEAALITALLLIVTAMASTTWMPLLDVYKEVMILLIVPLALWGTLRLGQWGAVLSVFAASIFPIWGTVRGFSPFGAPLGTGSEILLQVFLVVTSTTALTVAAVLAERAAAAKELTASKASLARRVEERTRELRSEKDFTSAVLDSIGALIVVLTPNAEIIRFNRACETFTGKRFEDVKGRSIWEVGVIPGPEIPFLQENFHPPPERHENHWIAADGTERIFRWSNTFLGPLAGEEGFVIAVGVDVTPERVAQAEALESIRARDEFLSIASHELKTPLTTLQLQIQSLRRIALANGTALSKGMTGIEMSLRQVRRLNRLVDELLDVSRITDGRLALESEEVDLAQVLREVVHRYGDESRIRGSAISLQGADRPVIGVWDSMRIDQILANLLSNAMKYGRGRPIHVELQSDRTRAILVVRDEGIGISPEDQERIFVRFERAVSIRHYGGFGLGLWITRQIVEAHGGTISVESEEGEGSTFTVTLPLRKE